MELTKRCPYCGEEILAAAKKCKHCREWLDQSHEDSIGSSAPTQQNSFRVTRTGIFCVIAVILAIAATAVWTSLPTDKHSGDDYDNLLFESNEKAVTDKEPIEITHEKSEDKEIETVRNLLAKSHYTIYENGRFGYSISYPDCFIPGAEPQNGDGNEFSLTQDISFSVWGGYYNEYIYGETLKNYYEDDDDKKSATYHVQKDNWYVMSGYLADGRVYYKKVILMFNQMEEGVIATFYLVFPKKYNDVLADFISYEAKNFIPVYDYM